MKKIMLKIILTGVCMFIFATNAQAAEYFISPAGNDINDGTSEINAIATFNHAYTIMSGGDTLTLLDGVYNQELHPPASLSGSLGNYTTFQAKNPGNVILAPSAVGDDEAEGVIYVYSSTTWGISSYMHFDGLFAKGVGEKMAISVASMDFAEENEMTHDIKITRCGAMGSAKDYNIVVADIGGARDVLIEDGFFFGFGRKALQLYGSRNITVRRVVVRYDWWEGDLYKPNDPRVNLSTYNTINATLENIISIDFGLYPVGLNPDKAALVASGNQGGGTTIDGSENVNYLGCVVYNNNLYSSGVNGVEIDGGTGDPVTNLKFKNIVIYGTDTGFNINDNIDGIDVENITSTHNAHVGIRINAYPNYGIANASIDKVVSTDNVLDGIWDQSMATITNATIARNGEGADMEAAYEPTINYLPTNTPVVGHERGGVIENRYVDGVLTNEPLWPWPYEDIVKQYMCNVNYLQEMEDVINNYNGTSITYMPGLCASGKTLTRYLWEAFGNNCPDDICNTSNNTRADVDNSGTINSTDAMLTLRNSLSLDMTSTNWQVSATTGDVNCDDITNSTDAMLILRQSLGLDMTGTGWCVS